MEEKIFISLTKDELQSIIIESVSACLKYSKHILGHPPEEDQFLNLEEAANFLNLTSRTVSEKARAGEIPSIKRARRLYFSKQHLSEWLKAGSRKTNAEISAEADTYIQGKKI